LAKENLQISNIISIKETKTNFTHVEPRAAHRSRNRYAVFLHNSNTAYFYQFRLLFSVACILVFACLFVCLWQEPLAHNSLQRKLPRVLSASQPHHSHSTETGTAAQGKEQE
jgi:hypothetical protein